MMMMMKYSSKKSSLLFVGLVIMITMALAQNETIVSNNTTMNDTNETVGIVLVDEVPSTTNNVTTTTNNETETPPTTDGNEEEEEEEPIVPIDNLFNNTENGMADNNVTTTMQNETVLYDGCNVDVYYSTLSTDVATWTMDDVETLIRTTHVHILPSIATENDIDDVIDALIDIDAGTNTSDTVYLYMRHIEYESKQVNVPEGWRRGDLWPLSRNANLSTTAGTDVHAKRPEDWEVQTELSELFWGTCGTVRPIEDCVVPAIPDKTDITTAMDERIKTPPERMRGIIARAVLYVALRYRTELGLFLSDCPPFNVTEYGYLSELLVWHSMYPVTDAERERNDRVCSRWQGNRNPYIDYPQLVEQFYGIPDTINNDTMTYTQCTDPTLPPTATPNECAALDAGDINALIMNSDPIDQIVFFPVSDIDESIGTIYVTDRAWNGSQFVTDEGTIEYSIPPGGIKAGRVFGYGVEFPDDKGMWEKSTDSDSTDTAKTTGTTFDLSSTKPDNLFIYCMNADNVPHFLQAIVYTTAANGTTTGFVEAGKSSYEYTETSLPDDLSNSNNGVLVLPFNSNFLYNGPREGNKQELLAAFADPANYAGSATPYNINTSGAVDITGTRSMIVSIVLGIIGTVVYLL